MVLRIMRRGGTIMGRFDIYKELGLVEPKDSTWGTYVIFNKNGDVVNDYPTRTDGERVMLLRNSFTGEYEGSIGVTVCDIDEDDAIRKAKCKRERFLQELEDDKDLYFPKCVIRENSEFKLLTTDKPMSYKDCLLQYISWLNEWEGFPIIIARWCENGCSAKIDIGIDDCTFKSDFVDFMKFAFNKGNKNVQ